MSDIEARLTRLECERTVLEAIDADLRRRYRRWRRAAILALAGLGSLGVLGLSGRDVPPVELRTSCPPDSVQVGQGCVDLYEASIWETTDAAVIAKIRQGTVTLSDLVGAGALQRGVLGDNYGSACPDTGNQCHDLYAVSIAGVPPSRFITWFQAVAAARNAHKRLPTNQEWQAAAFGTPDPGTDNAATDCNVASPLVLVDTGSRSLCVSDVGLRDAVGNLWEWVADWTRHGNGGCSAELVAGTGDYNCQVGLGDGPAALARGGTGDLALAGVFAIIQRPPTESQEYIGFRAAR